MERERIRDTEKNKAREKVNNEEHLKSYYFKCFILFEIIELETQNCGTVYILLGKSRFMQDK